MSFDVAADHILQGAKSYRRANTGTADDKLWARVGDSEGRVQVAAGSDYIWVHYLGLALPIDSTQPGDLMICRNTTRRRYEAGDFVNVAWMDDGGASTLKVQERKSIVLSPQPFNFIGHVGGIEYADPEFFGDATLEIQDNDGTKRMVSAYAIRPSRPKPDVGPTHPDWNMMYQGVCGHPTEHHSYLMACIYRGQIIEVQHGLARIIAGAQSLDEALAGSPEAQEGLSALGPPGVQIAPRGLVAAPDGTIYVLCNGPIGYPSKLIGKFTIGGNWHWVFGIGTDPYGGDGDVSTNATGHVTQMALDADGSLYLTDSKFGVVRKILGPVTGGTIIERVAGYDPLVPPLDPPPDEPITDPLLQQLSRPMAITVDQETGDVYFGDFDYQLVYRISGGSIERFITPPNNVMPGLTVGPPAAPGGMGDRKRCVIQAVSLAWGKDGALYYIHGEGIPDGDGSQHRIGLVHGPVDPYDKPNGAMEWLAGTENVTAYPAPSFVPAATSVYGKNTTYPFPQAQINLALSLSFDLCGDLYFTDGNRLMVRKLVDDDYWVATAYKAGGATRTMTVRPDGKYADSEYTNGANYMAGVTAELDTTKKLVGIKKVFNDGANNYEYTLRVLDFNEEFPNGGYYAASTSIFPFKGGIEGLDPHFRAIFDEARLINMVGNALFFVRSAQGAVTAYRVVANNPPPNDGEVRYHLEAYDSIAIPGNEEILQVVSSSLYASMVYFHTNRYSLRTIPSGIGTTDVVTIERRLWAYDGIKMKDITAMLRGMGLEPRSGADMHADRDFDIFNLDRISYGLTEWCIEISDIDELDPKQKFLIVKSERLSATPKDGSFSLFLGHIVENPKFSPMRHTAVFGRSWYAGRGAVLDTDLPPVDANFTYGGPKKGESFGFVRIFSLPWQGGSVDHFVIAHGAIPALGGDAATFTGPVQMVGVNFAIVVGGGLNMPYGIWAITSTGLFLLQLAADRLALADGLYSPGAVHKYNPPPTMFGFKIS